MQYTLLSNGKIVAGDTVFSGDILIGNNRIMELGKSVRKPTPDTILIDVENKYLLPGLVHYNCPFIKSDEEPLSSSIYIALSHGSTYLMDTLKIKRDEFNQKKVAALKNDCLPIISDFGLHLDAFRCSKLSKSSIDLCYIKEGISSLFLKFKHFEKFAAGELNDLLDIISEEELLLICETKHYNSQSISKKKNISIYLNQLKEISYLLRKKRATVLFLGISSSEEMEILNPGGTHSERIFVALDLNMNNDFSESSLSINHLKKFHSNQNILIAPPELESPGENSNKFIENRLDTSFLSAIMNNQDTPELASLVNLCDMYATRPAKLLGIYPQKGHLQQGSDADIIIWDPENLNADQPIVANITLFRKDIFGLILNGKYIGTDQIISSREMLGRYIYRNSVTV